MAWSKESISKRTLTRWGFHNFEERFWAKVKKLSDMDCWEWTACKNKKGYGALVRDGKGRIASRESWMLANGPIPKGLCVLHRCDNPPCVNPSHLFLGTAKDNALDALQKGRLVVPKGEQHWKCRLSIKQVIKIRNEFAGTATSFSALARRLRLNPSIVARVVRGESWKHVPNPHIIPPKLDIKKKLIAKQVKAIKRLISSKRTSLTDIAEKYRVDISTISCIKRGITWKAL